MSGVVSATIKTISPIRCNEKPWDLWVSEIGHRSPRQDDGGPSFSPPADCASKGGPARRAPHPSRGKTSRNVQYKRTGINRLKHSTMSLHGLFPQLDDLNAVVCHMCGMTVKCSAAHRHLLEYHSASSEPILPPPPPAPTVKLKSHTKSRHKKEPLPSPVELPAPSPPGAPPPPIPTLHIAPQDLQYFPEVDAVTPKQNAHSEVKVCVEDNDLPVVSIQDSADLPLGDSLTDDIFEIMNSEGIQSAESISEADTAVWNNIMQDISSIQEMSFSQNPPPDSIAPAELYGSIGPNGALTGGAFAVAAEISDVQFAQPVVPVRCTDSAGARPQAGSSPVSSAKPSRHRIGRTKSKYNFREYDPNKHCGVVTVETQKPCTRSLTCKAHTLSSRRSVAGRCKAFDLLLAEHRAAREAAAPPPAPLPLLVPPPPLSPIAAPPSLAIQPSILTPLDISTFNNLTAEQQVDLYSTFINSGDGTAGLPDTTSLASLLSQALPADQYLLTEEPVLGSDVPVLSIASPLESGDFAPLLQAPSVQVEEKVAEPEPMLTVNPSDVCWYSSPPRPLALCTFSSYQVNGAVTIGKRTIRSNVKSLLSRHSGKAPAASGASYSNFSSNVLSSLTKSVHSNSAAKTSKPGLRKLIMTCPAFLGSSAKSDQTYGDMSYSSSSVRHNGHYFNSKRHTMDDYDDMDSKRLKSNSESILKGNMKVAKHVAPGDMLELSFIFDPLDEKC